MFDNSTEILSAASPYLFPAVKGGDIQGHSAFSWVVERKLPEPNTKERVERIIFNASASKNETRGM